MCLQLSITIVLLASLVYSDPKWIYHRELGLHHYRCQGKCIRSLQRHSKMPLATDLDDDNVKDLFELELGMPEDAVARLSAEGIERLEDLVEFASENVKTNIGNLRRPRGR